ncbi:hypothetical protein GGS21DRAFT_386239 [Xylaria nigripes]|nr:hypothetical protein GGS21DRAFT_386239 [Xylaria nigripes]
MGHPSSQAPNSELELTTDVDDIYAWAVYSPYSPLNLQHLNQPRLQGAPRHLAGQFTFRDAFEDLLTAQAGRPLPSILELTKRKSWDVIPTLHVFQWVRELGVQGLWGSYFALAPSLQNRFSWMPPRSVNMPTWWLHFQTPPYMALYYRLGRPEDVFMGSTGLISELFRPFREHPEEQGAVDEDIFTFLSKTAFPELLRVIREERKGPPTTDEDVDKFKSNSQSSKLSGNIRDRLQSELSNFFNGIVYGPSRGQPREQAATEEDLYDSVGKFSGWQDARVQESTDDVLVKLPESKPKTSVEKQTHTPIVTTTVYAADGSKLVQTTERHSCNGKKEVTMTSKHFDAQGNLMAERTESSITRSWSGQLPGSDASFSWSWNKNSKTGGEKVEDTDENDAKKRGQGGWFWER